MSNDKILLARQPIYDASLCVAAYELLFRPADPNVVEAWDGDKATSEVILNAFTEVGIETVTESLPAYINFTRKWLMEPPSFDAEQVVIEILEDIEIDDEVLQALTQLSEQGYKLALDDFIYEPKYDPVLRLASIVKLDVLAHDKFTIAKWVEKLKPYNLFMIAEKVETHDMMEFCKRLGFEGFQGYFLCRPQFIKGSTLPASKVVVMQLLGELQRVDVQFVEIEQLIAQDPTLTVKLLRVLNSASYALPKKVDSIKRAVTLLGLEKLKSWASVIALSRMTDKPHALLLTALIRAKMCERLAEQSGLDDIDHFFTVGLFSTLDAFFDREMSEVLDSLPLAEETNNSILFYSGQAGKILQSVRAHEQADWDRIDWPAMEELDITAELLETAYIDSIRWATAICNSILN